MHEYRYKAYTLNKWIKKGDKLASCALIGHLISYDLTNIYWIWIPSIYKVIRTRDVIFDGNSFYDPKGQNIDYLLRDVLEDTIQTINLLEPLYKDESEDESILYIVDLTPKGSILNSNQIIIFKLNDLVEHPIKDIK